MGRRGYVGKIGVELTGRWILALAFAVIGAVALGLVLQALAQSGLGMFHEQG